MAFLDSVRERLPSMNSTSTALVQKRSYGRTSAAGGGIGNERPGLVILSVLVLVCSIVIFALSIVGMTTFQDPSGDNLAAQEVRLPSGILICSLCLVSRALF